VDTGATYTVIPESTLKELRISPLRSERVSLADDRLVERDVGEVGTEVEVTWQAQLQQCLGKVPYARLAR